MITVIIPLYNAARFIEETLQAVQSQTYTDWECVVVDDGSTDNGAEIVQRMAQADTRIHYVYQSNAGPSAARNHGLRLAKGDYIQFLDADDWFPPQRFERMLSAYMQTSEKVILYSGLCLGAEDDIHHHMPYSARTNVGDIDFKRMYGGFGREFSFIPGAILFPAAYLKHVQCARIDALYRRIGGDASASSELLTQGPFLMNTRNHTLEKNGNRIRLTQVEYAILKLFMQNPGRALSREDILAAVWGRDYEGELKIVDVNIRRLRIKIEDDTANPTYITTVWGLGYKWGA